MKQKLIIILFFLSITTIQKSIGQHILIPMDSDTQKDHLKAYGLAYWILQNKLD